MMKTILFIAIFLTAIHAAPLLKTGQTKSYDQNGNEVTDGSIKDDGYYQMGSARNYSSGNIVIDKVTGLQWQDNESISKRWLSDTNYDTCKNNSGSSDCNDTSGDTADTYCKNLSLGGYSDWRLPTIEELETLVDEGNYDPGVTKHLFQHISSDYYWSSTTNAESADDARIVDFYDGVSSYGSKKYSNHVRCVRGKQLETSKFTRSGDIVSDSVTGLSWQDNTVVKSTVKSWIKAIEYCENLTLGGHNDWRLPNRKELLFIADRSKSYPAINSAFQNVSWTYHSYWSSTTYANLTSDAWIVRFGNGLSSISSKNNGHYVRCVRNNGQPHNNIFITPILYLLW